MATPSTVAVVLTLQATVPETWVSWLWLASAVTFAAGAVARSQALKSLRRAERVARYDFTVLLSKSIFLPFGGFVFADVERGSPFNWTMAEVLSWPGCDVGPSEGAPRDP